MRSSLDETGIIVLQHSALTLSRAREKLQWDLVLDYQWERVTFILRALDCIVQCYLFNQPWKWGGKVFVDMLKQKKMGHQCASSLCGYSTSIDLSLFVWSCGLQSCRSYTWNDNMARQYEHFELNKLELNKLWIERKIGCCVKPWCWSTIPKYGRHTVLHLKSK